MAKFQLKIQENGLLNRIKIIGTNFINANHKVLRTVCTKLSNHSSDPESQSSLLSPYSESPSLSSSELIATD